MFITEPDFLNSLTDETVQAWGYANVEMYMMEYQLGKLAGQWRRTKDAAVVQKYHLLFRQLTELGWDPSLLDVESALPDELMPKTTG
ncbi:hypothetical protein A2368_04220 [Candidatus Collierbacteria bacterium RIFOXYB1_FULL_49_13]|uniref:Uncharacterized protein n=1 Tax=Candidatus Collierbacteria bacterium RIFOXYB1_FULL_49_13 TaxID=1817728 RepID=A0A1F5FK83_9BACT|nr:MAG: hypothetical protein A2368_04220 [Candidatus Collierbacteria bacterium RIFOXYB1_FULL_49_13]